MCVFLMLPAHICSCDLMFVASRVERSTDQVIKPVNVEALSKWVGKIPADVVRDMAVIAPMLSRLGYDPHANPPNYGRPDPKVLDNTRRVSTPGRTVLPSSSLRVWWRRCCSPLKVPGGAARREVIFIRLSVCGGEDSRSPWRFDAERSHQRGAGAHQSEQRPASASVAWWR